MGETGRGCGVLNATQKHEAANWAQELKGNRAVNEFWGTAGALGMHLTTAAGAGKSRRCRRRRWRGAAHWMR